MEVDQPERQWDYRFKDAYEEEWVRWDDHCSYPEDVAEWIARERYDNDPGDPNDIDFIVELRNVKTKDILKYRVMAEVSIRFNSAKIEESQAV